jgi:glycosyltransferase involved in cell wall biosynthesis
VRVSIDLTALTPTVTGVDRYLLELVRHLPRIDRENRYTVFVNVRDRRRFEGRLADNVTVRPCGLPSRPLRLLFQHGALPVLAAAGRFDVVHSPSFLMPLWRGRARHLLTVHDMTFFSMPAVHTRLRRSATFRRGIVQSVQRADLVNVPSEATRRDVLHWIPGVDPGKVRVTPWGIQPEFSPAPPTETARHLARLGIPRPYILHVGTIEPRKNLITLLDSYRRLLRDGATGAHLVLAGADGWDSDRIRRAAGAPELRGRVRFLGHVSDEALPWIYRGASMFVFPSLYEGFGFPPLEAMACGIPVIAAGGSSLEENLRGAADLVAPLDGDAWAAAMRRLETDAAWHRRLAALGLERSATFRWERTVQKVLDCYVELAGPP